MLRMFTICVPLFFLIGCQGGSAPETPAETPTAADPDAAPPEMEAPAGQTEPAPPSTVADPFTDPEPATTDDSAGPPNENSESGPELLPQQGALPESAAIPIRLMNWEGVQQQVQAHQGKVVIVNLWTTTCLTCLREFPHIASLQEKHPDDVVCIAVNCDYDGIADKPPAFYLPQVRKFLAGQSQAIENLLITASFLDVLEQLDLNSTPAVFVYDRDGKLVKRFDNDDATSEADEFTHANVEDLLETLIASP